MRNPRTLHICTNRIDAYFLKNVVQNITNINLDIKKNENCIVLVVDKCNYTKASNIVKNQLSILPSIAR
ncbi:hypothetical protein [Wenyingzhuangia sp. IMCC45574]